MNEQEIKWEAKLIKHDHKSRIGVWFPNHKDFINRFKKLTDARWSSSLKCWHLPDTETNRLKFRLTLDPKPRLNTDKINEIESFKKYLNTKRYSPNTVKTYSEALHIFLLYFNEKIIKDINNQDVITFYNDYILTKKLSSSFQNQIVNAIKLYFKTIKESAIVIERVFRPKCEKLLPNVLSKEEIKQILTVHTNIKHKAMLCLIYSCGLRRSELLHLKLNDIDSKRNLVIIRQAKGRKDRIAPLSSGVLALLRIYYAQYQPQTWLFEGQNPNSAYNERS